MYLQDLFKAKQLLFNLAAGEACSVCDSGLPIQSHTSYFQRWLTSLQGGHVFLTHWWWKHNKTLKTLFAHLVSLVHPSQLFAMKTAAKYPLNAKLLQQDSWGLKKLFTYGCRKAGFGKPNEKSPNRRELWPLFSSYFWRWKKGVY